MSTFRIQTGVVEPIQVYAVDILGNALTGLSDLFIRVRRDSDGFYFDWSDDTFKSVGFVTLNQILTEQDAVNAAGLYDIAGGWDTSLITNPDVDYLYTVIPIQTPGTNAILPAPSNLQVGQFIDRLDAGDDRTHISATYDDVGLIVSISFWLERSGVITTPINTLGSVVWRNPDGTTLFSNSSPSGPDSQGVLRFTQPSITLIDNTPYYADVTVEDSQGVVTTQIGVPFQA